MVAGILEGLGADLIGGLGDAGSSTITPALPTTPTQPDGSKAAQPGWLTGLEDWTENPFGNAIKALTGGGSTQTTQTTPTKPKTSTTPDKGSSTAPVPPATGSGGGTGSGAAGTGGSGGSGDSNNKDQGDAEADSPWDVTLPFPWFTIHINFARWLTLLLAVILMWWAIDLATKGKLANAVQAAGRTAAGAAIIAS